MADATDLIDLYSKRILALAADIPHVGHLAQADAKATKRSPLCGSTVTAEVKLDGDRLEDLGLDVKACALGQASASILGSLAIGRTREALAEGRDALAAMLKQNAAPPSEAPYDALAVLEPARDYRNRHASIMLAWDAVLAAMDEAKAAA